jgi:hypothetical protein
MVCSRCTSKGGKISCLCTDCGPRLRGFKEQTDMAQRVGESASPEDKAIG